MTIFCIYFFLSGPCSLHISLVLLKILKIDAKYRHSGLFPDLTGEDAKIALSRMLTWGFGYVHFIRSGKLHSICILFRAPIFQGFHRPCSFNSLLYSGEGKRLWITHFIFLMSLVCSNVLFLSQFSIVVCV